MSQRNYAPPLKPDVAEARRLLTKTHRRQALMKVDSISPHGTVLVKCPYCLIYLQLVNMVDVGRWVELEGKRENKAECSKGHTLKFRTIEESQEERAKIMAGAQL